MPRNETETIVWPSGGFQWTAQIREELPIIRGIHAPTPAEPLLLMTSLLALEKELDAQAASLSSKSQEQQRLALYDTHAFESKHSALRQAIAAATEKEYVPAFEFADAMRTRSNAHKQACAFLFPHIAEWTLECFQAAGSNIPNMLWYSVIPLDQFLLAASRGGVWLSPSLKYLLIHLHGERAFEVPGLALNADAHGLPERLKLFLSMHVPSMIPTLAAAMNAREVREALEGLITQYPAAVLYSSIDQALSTRSDMLVRWAIRLALRHPAAQNAAIAALDETKRNKFRELLDGLTCNEATPEQLPDLLLSPPWAQKKRPAAPPVLDFVPLPLEERLEWLDGQQEEAAAFKADVWWVNRIPANAITPEFILKSLCIAPAAHAGILRGAPITQADIETAPHAIYICPDLLFYLPQAVALTLWNSYRWPNSGEHTHPITAIMALHGVAAMDGLIAYTNDYPELGLEIALRIDSPRLVPVALYALRNTKKAKPAAISWIRAHRQTVAKAILPLAFSNDASIAQDARVGLYWFSENGYQELLTHAAAHHGAAVADALRGLDPLFILPAKIPKLPAFYVPASFTRPQLHNGRAMPLAALEHVGVMLAISKPETPYAGLKTLRNICTASSLADFAWDLFEAWTESGSSSKEAWAFTALGLLGNDDTAQRLTPKIREWPGESAHTRAVLGLDLLATIGSDVALMHLNAIANKSKFKPLQERAKEKIAQVAEVRGFTADELADRLVPDLGLDDSGRLVLDFGPRKFHVSFDEALKPCVKDDKGTRLKDLPKPAASDDAALGEAASDIFKKLKKDAKAIAGLQLLRLETSMVARRRWPAAEFRMFFLQHPLVRHIAARLVWGVYVDDKLMQAFRIAEDWTLADHDDVRYQLLDEAIVGIAHVLETPSHVLNAFGQIFADYEIQQPFRQLGRECYALTGAEEQLSSITRYQDKCVATGSVLGLAERGWQRSNAESGWVTGFKKHLGADWQVDLTLAPGTSVTDISSEPRQQLPELTLRKRGTQDANGLLPFSCLPRILLSETLRDIELLAALKK